jgi:hypothetical protein
MSSVALEFEQLSPAQKRWVKAVLNTSKARTYSDFLYSVNSAGEVLCWQLKPEASRKGKP